ncbi:hypothetical protein BD779DRAFT_1560397 [Infundibulicybe gibba]|nr:hypothetical protein BD779DRAFT_1560397 [Infundibulicybe gibba]
MRERKEDKLDLPVYEAHPPAWLPQAHGSADLGYMGFYPPQPGQDEDILSAKNMREGFVLGEQVSAENFSAQAMINENLHSSDTLSKLEELMNEVFSRRAERIPAIPSLGKYIPHGAKGHDLLDLLHSKNVALPRAVWFLRVFGANETAGLRNKPHYDPGQYSIDWANLVTSYMKKQLVDIALPIAARPGLNIKQTFKGVLSDPETRERWISRFTYCLKLLRSFYREGLVDHRTFLVWVVQQISTCNLAQAGFVTRLADEYLDGMFGSRALARPFADACLGKLSEIRATSAQEYLVSTDGLIKSLLQRLCLAIPDAFVSPRMWAIHSNLLTNILSENTIGSNDQHIGQSGRDVQQMLLCHLADIRRRNEAMLFRNLPIRVSARLGSAVSDVKLLNSISSTTNMDSMSFFANDGDDVAFAEKLDMLLTWSVTPLQYGDHRPFAAVTLIRKWRERAGDRATRRDFTPPDEFLQDHLFEWLDSSEVSENPDNIRAVALLFGKLVKHELFSYAKYIQRLIARGSPDYHTQSASRHRNFLRWIPLFQSDPAMVNQRKVTLYGVRARETEEDINGRQIRKEIRAVLPDVFGGNTESPAVSTTALLANCGTLVSAVRYEQVRIFRTWLLPILQKHIPSQTSEVSQTGLLNTYCISVELMTHAKCFHSILDLTLCVLEHPVALALLNAVVDTLRRFATIWACINVKGHIIKALDNAYHLWKTMKGIQSRTLLDLLIEFDQGHYLDSTSRERVRADIASITLALQPIASRPESVPDVLPEILVLAGDPNPDAPSILANGLWIKYRISYDWAWKVWDNTVASLRQVPTMTPDIASRRACSLRYGTFLWHVDRHLPEGLDGQVMRWFLGPGKNEVAALNSETWDVFSTLLLYLAVHGALRTTTILRGLIYPTWQQAARLSGPQLVSMINLLGAANFLCQRLLLCEGGSGEDMPPTDIFDVQCLRTRRQAVYDDNDFSMLVASIPLLIMLEHNDQLPGELRQESTMLCRRLCQDRDFRLGAHRNLSIIRDAFEGSLQTAEGNAEQFNQHIIGGLYDILCDSDDIQISNWPAITSMLSPWKIPATTMKLQFVLRQMGHALTQESTQHTASADLDKLILMIFHHSMTSDEAYYVAEMARGVESTVASKFVNHGLKCIAEVLQESMTYNAEQFRRAGELLRVLIYLVEPLREDLASLPILDPSIQDEFFNALCIKFTGTEALSINLEDNETDYCQITQGIIFLARLLQFDLGLQGAWTSKTKEASSGLSSSIFKLALLHGTGEGLDLVAYPLLIDTLYYLYDEIPADAKSVTFDPFRNSPDITASDIPSELPLEYRKQFMLLLPHLLSITVVTNLVTSHRDAAGNVVYGPPVINRPWEWTEYIGESSDPNEESKDQEEKEHARMKYPIRNSGSLSLETFGARLTGDGIIHNLSPSHDPRVEGNLLTFEDGLSADCLFKRDWRETRLNFESESTFGNSTRAADSEAGESYYPGLLRGDKRTTPKVSPASSVVSRSSARGSANSMRTSPNQSALNRLTASTVSEILEVESIATASSSKQGSGSKRKSAPTASDDEIEIIEGPLPIPTKKPRGKATVKTRAKKK